MIIKKYFLFIGLLFYSVQLFAQDEVAKATRVSTPVKVDGKASEWNLPLSLYDSDTKLFFGFANDDKNIYLCFQSADEISQEKIMKAGMEVTLSEKGKHRVSIDFPLEGKSRSAHGGSDLDNNQYRDRINRQDSFLLHDTVMEVKGFETRNGIIPIHDSSGINAAINWDQSNKMTYEIAIPLKEFLGNDFSPDDLAKEVSLDITINQLKGYRKATRSHSSGSGGSGMSGRGMGGRMGGGGMRHQSESGDENAQSTQPSGNNPNDYQKSILKQKFLLAQAPNTR
jgi:uncharacterized membrane protein YgcG